MSVESTRRSPDPDSGASLGAPEVSFKTAGESAPPAATVASRGGNALTSFLAGSAGRNLGLVIALVLLCIVGLATAGDRFASVDNVMTILRLAAVIGVVSIGMTFVIGGGGIPREVPPASRVLSG